MNRFSLVCVATLCLCAIGRAQPTLPPEVPRGIAEPEPLIDAAAQQFIEQMVARYAALKSYSDVTRVHIENAAGEPANAGEMTGLNFRATLQWERPANIRFEGTSAKGAFLALGTAEIMRVVSPDYADKYVARPRSRTVTGTVADGPSLELPPQPIQFDAPLMEVQAGGPTMGFLEDTKFWERTRKDVRSLRFAADARADGQECRVLEIQLASDDGSIFVSRLFVAKSDGLLRRSENRDNRMPTDTFIIETHSDVRANPDLPAATWSFTPPVNAKPVDYFFQLDEGKYDPDIKIGELLPTFSADALDGTPLELNPKSGKVTVVYFFTMNSGAYDVQILNKLARIAGPQKLQVVGVSGDGLRPRVEDFAARYGLSFPIYFDESGRKNLLAQKFGVKGWASTFIFGTDGKLQFIGSRPDSIEVIQGIQKVLPGIGNDFFILQDDELIIPA